MTPRGLRAEDAATYCGCKTLSAFYHHIRQGRLPRAMPGTRIWDRHALDAALDKMSGLPQSEATSDGLEEWLNARAAQGR
jgi:predicted DNA-binding transcriptional regulator AlpA